MSVSFNMFSFAFKMLLGVCRALQGAGRHVDERAGASRSEAAE